ncbi:hypothetical protein CHARACLAT_018808 [Characodon lateralis]|uniref:Uncharacterized protein n=1 Tax=Characodon lateralis TaxID=208331 RepID=A0ABU7EAT2_9TELE|nr:hypothetical protein [Characodon lateralis]
MVHSDSVSNIPLSLVRALPEVGVEYIPGRVHCQTFPADPHYALGPAKSARLSPLPADPTHHQVVISGQLSSLLHPIFIHWGKPQHKMAELGGNKQTHPSPPPLPLGHSRVEESPAPLKEMDPFLTLLRNRMNCN